MLQALNTIL